MREPRDYDDIPGTYVFDGEHSRKGYALNMFCMSLNQEVNRERFRADEPAYLDDYDLSPAQRSAILDRDWLEMLRLGGNIYYTFKLAIVDGLVEPETAAECREAAWLAYRQQRFARSVELRERRLELAAGVRADPRSDARYQIACCAALVCAPRATTRAGCRRTCSRARRATP